jgi:dCMP deaminase
MEVAMAVVKRSTCIDKNVGCVIVNKTGHILATGYNGVSAGKVHCCDTGICLQKQANSKFACVAVHAEINALIQCQNILDIYAVYCTLEPCAPCIRAIMNTSAKYIYFAKHSKYAEPSKKIWGNDETWILLK